MDATRWDRVRQALADHGLDALVVRLPENVVLLSGYWPVIGRSVVLMAPDREPVLLAPELELPALTRATVKDIRTFHVWWLDDPAPDEALARLVRDVLRSWGLQAGRIGWEGSFEDISPTQKVLEPWAPAAGHRRLVAAAAGEETELVDATDLLLQLRARKTPGELERLRLVHEVASFGVEAFYEHAVPGRTEIEVAAAVERAVLERGTGYKGAVHARAVACVMAGRERLWRLGWGVAPPSAYRLQPGDPVMLELCVVVDGMYADLTRMVAVPPADGAYDTAVGAVREAVRAALDAVRPGVPARDVDAAAREALARHGLAQAFVHHTGHGVGFRYHEPIPFLHPAVESPLEEGMVFSVEPGVYGPELGGIRIEENVAVTPNGVEVLSARVPGGVA